MIVKKQKSRLFISVIVLVVIGVLAVPGISKKKYTRAEEIVERSDLSRGPNRKFSFSAKIVNYKKGDKVGELILRVNVYDRNRSLVKYISPKKDSGKKLLMVRENLWFFTPTSKRVIRISAQQKLMGQVSNGDLARTNYAGDYIPKILGSERIKVYKKNVLKNCYKMELIKKTKAATYHRVIYWIEKRTYRPQKAEYYARSGRILKTAYFTNYKRNKGRLRVGTMIVINAIVKTRKTIIHYGRFSNSRIPLSRYQKSQLSQ